MIDAQTLKLKGACAAQAELFKVLFPDGADLTVENALSVAHRFDWNWAAQNLLSPENRNAYNAVEKPARDARDAAMKSAINTYNAVVMSARGARDAAVRSARDVYDVAVKPANGVYGALVRSALDARSAAVKLASVARGAAVKLASVAHNTAVNSACDVYDATRARAFAEIYVKQESQAS